MKIGFPRALLYYYYFPLWKTLFEELGVDLVVSGKTTKKIMDTGVRFSVAEICVPIKVFAGHVESLLETDVDYVFIPRMITVEYRKWFCPKFMGLPDMMQSILPNLTGRLLIVVVVCDFESMVDFKEVAALAFTLGVTAKQVKNAFKIAKDKWLEFRRYSFEGKTIEQALARFQGDSIPEQQVDHQQRLQIGVLGYVYNIYDSFIGMDIISKLNSMGAKVTTFEMLDDTLITEKLKPVNKTMPWSFTNKLLAASYSFFKDNKIDGLIHVTAFGCGPDSMLGKLLELDSLQHKKPFMTIRVDEQTGEAHLSTRIEAFVDMLRRRKILLSGVN